LLVVSEVILEALGSLKRMLTSYPPSGFDDFGHLSGFGELNGSFFNPYVVVDKWRLYHVIKYAWGESGGIG
jgi:hypothetical protein